MSSTHPATPPARNEAARGSGPIVVVVQAPVRQKTPLEKYRESRGFQEVKFYSLFLVVLGFTQIFTQVAIHVMGSKYVAGGILYDTFVPVGQGYWGGALFIFNGWYGTQASHKTTEMRIINLYWFSLLSTLACLFSIFFSIFGIIDAEWHQGGLRITYCILIILTVVPMIATTIICCYTCKVVCRPNHSNNSSEIQAPLTEIITSADDQGAEELSQAVSAAMARQAASGQGMTNRRLSQVINTAVTAVQHERRTQPEDQLGDDCHCPPPPYSKAVGDA